MTNKLIDGIKVFSWEQLQGKILKIVVGVDEQDGYETTVVNGYEETTGNLYVLHVGTHHMDNDFFEGNK